MWALSETGLLNKDILTQLQEALVSHGLPAVKYADFISVEGGRLELEAEVFEREILSAGKASIVLEVRAYSAPLGGRPIIECFAGVGDSKDQAVSNAFAKMLLGVFHVLIEALTSHSCEDQVEVESWKRQDAAWKIFSGPLLTQYSDNSTLSDSYPEVISKLDALFVEMATPGPHWIRVFVGAYHGQIQAIEVLLDNEDWGQAQSILVSQDWACTEDYQSLRHFVLALPA